MDLRARIVLACEGGQSQGEVGRRFGVCAKTVGRYVKRAKEGQLAPRPLPGRTRRVGPDQEAALVQLVQEDPDRTLAQMSALWQERSGQLLPSSTLHDALGRLDGRFKKKSGGQREG